MSELNYFCRKHKIVICACYGDKVLMNDLTATEATFDGKPNPERIAANIAHLEAALQKAQEENKRLKQIEDVARVLAEQFKAISQDHDEKLGKSFEEAEANWVSLKQGPLEFGPLLEALQMRATEGESK